MNTKLPLAVLDAIAAQFPPRRASKPSFRAGRVIRLEPEAGDGILLDKQTGQRFKFSRGMLGARAFDGLRDGDEVSFRDDGTDGVTAVEPIPGGA